MNGPVTPDLYAQRLAHALELASWLELALLTVVIGTGLTAFATIVRAALPWLVRGLDETIRRRSRGARLALGALNGTALFLLAIVLGNRTETKALGIVLFFLLVFLILLGLAAELSALGRRVLALSEREGTDLSRGAAGGAALTFSFFLPIVGWALVVAVLLLSVGTAVSWIFGRAIRRSFE